MNVHQAIRFLTKRLGALQARREFKAFDELEAALNKATAVDDFVREDEILRLAQAHGLTTEAMA